MLFELHRESGRMSAIVSLFLSASKNYRYNSTSSLFSPFTSFFNRTKAPQVASPQQVAPAFLNSISVQDTDALRSAYDTIITSPNPSELLSPNDIHAAMELLASSSFLKDLETLRRIFEDLPNRFGYDTKDEHRNLLIKGLCNNGRVEEAFILTKSLDPFAVNWRVLLRTASNHSPSIVNHIIPFLQQYSSLEQTDIALILKSLRSSLHTSSSIIVRKKLDGLLQQVQMQSIVLEPVTEAELMRLYISLGDLEKANTIVESWDKANIWSPGLYNAIIELYIARADAHQVEYTINKMREKGWEAPQKAISFLSIQHLQQNIDSRSAVGFGEIVGSIEYAEKISDVSAQADVWADVIRVYLREVKSNDSLDIALEVYSESLSRGIEPSAELAKNLIIPLCNSKESSRLNHAIRVYDDYMSTQGALSTRREQARFSSVYQYLLIGCSRSNPPLIEKAINLIMDMRNHKMEINSNNLVSLLILLMKSSEDHHSAFNLYSHFYSLSPSSIDENGYQAILSTYLGLSWSKSPYPPPELFVTILKDMSKNGYQPSSNILSSLLKTYGSQATKLRRNFKSSSSMKLEDNLISLDEQLDNLGQSIRDIHTLIKLDPLIVIDIPLLSSLMDAYSRVGAYSECFQVWDELIQRRSREKNSKKLFSASLNVILDACGWSYSLKRGKKIWLWSKKYNLIYEKKHYDSYIEFLCRNSQFHEVIEIIFNEMEKEGFIIDKDIIRIVLKFGRREADKGNNVNDVFDFVNRLKKEKGELYNQLKDAGENERW
uniref:Pentatricopeptide repeat domain-containing protein n=1 Tax=Kwoniella pini CBS 10737 TaxID=1296096 RepID=A0A1B9I7D2_9TREE|nr:uncharacterized protein I206_02075 [Kwoniella pini CBS 10737]OCF51361.1 hypothetical protein I206_02075 [Kwoniella pini CBS 10737]